MLYLYCNSYQFQLIKMTLKERTNSKPSRYISDQEENGAHPSPPAYIRLSEHVPRDICTSAVDPH